jgi:hypothetical protein
MHIGREDMKRMQPAKDWVLIIGVLVVNIKIDFKETL